MIETYDLFDLRRFTHGKGRKRGLHRRLKPADFRGFYYTAADTPAYSAGSSVTWASSGGTNVITCTSLAAGVARVGAKGATLVVAPPNGGTNAVLPDYLMFTLQCQLASPAAGAEVQLWLSFSNSATAATNNAGTSTGADSNLANLDLLPQMLFAGSLICSSSVTTGIQFAYIGPVAPLDAYFSPVIYNATAVAFDATALHTTLTMIPYWRQRAT